ncbi:MAG: LysM peptidoglycan-binding domain-containing protein [Treponema sp.]|jgi:hypothetical protein|nr:LysM peptidoglycan-binding domain-containing protein [Treponema sp.]
MKNNLVLFFIIFIMTVFHVFGDDDIFFSNDYISFIIEQLEEKSLTFELKETGEYENGKVFIVFRINDNIDITISTDEYEIQYIIGNVETNEAMREILNFLTEIYSEPIPYLNGNSYTAFYHDTENKYIKENFTDYIGTITLYDNYMLVEEVITQEKIIIQRQWCTPDFFEINTTEFGDNWGFITPWDTIVITDTEKVTLPAQYTVRRWRETGDSLSAIAGMPFIYNDPSKWRLLYEANKTKLPKQNNPNLIYPGTVLNIPSLEGENRSGLWKWE